MNKRERAKIFINKVPPLQKPAKLIFQKATRTHERAQTKKYHEWLKRYGLDGGEKSSQQEQAKLLAHRPLISVVVPTYNTTISFLDEMITSVVDQTYDNWELVVVDDASPNEDVRTAIKKHASMDGRIKYRFLKNNQHIAGATNEAIKMTRGEFISLFDHDDLLQPNALFEIVQAINKNRKLNFIYTDEDKLINGQRDQPFFKPDWNRDFLESVNYITHFTTIRRSILESFGYERSEYNGAQDWELFLRIARNIEKDTIHHIPKVLYSWRVHEASTAKSLDAKPYVIAAQKKAIEDDLQERGFKDFDLQQDEQYSGQWNLALKPMVTPRVTIAVAQEIAQQTAKHIEEHTGYKDYEVIAFSPTTTCQELLDKISGEYLVLVGERLSITSPGWIATLLGDAEREDIGFVLTKLHQDSAVMDLTQELVDGPAATLLATLSRRNVAKHLYTTTRHNVKTIRDGVVMIEASKLHSVSHEQEGPFDLKAASTALIQKGYDNLYNPYVKMLK